MSGSMRVPDTRKDTVAVADEIHSELATIVQDVAGIPAHEVRLDTLFVDDMDVDSLTMVEVAVAAEELFGVTIPDDVVTRFETVRGRRLHREGARS
jgi:acyl carrier protein